jgi:sigma-B regulation protein RsbU (phosphoserine phosphatase)
MAVCRTLILATGLKGASPDDCLTYVNSLLFSDNYSSMFVTVFYGILNAEKGEIDYVNAGHNAPYLLSGSGIQKLGTTDGIALGVLDKFSFHSSKLDIRPGEKLFICTNGITNSFNKEGTAYGTERLERFLNGHHSGPVETIIKESIDDLHAFTKDAPQSDDITLLALVYHGRNGPV